jgi:hypothetical protein
MKFLLVKDKDECKQHILNSIAEFLWDSGHEVDRVSSDYRCIENREHFDDYDCIITVSNHLKTFQSNLKGSNNVFNKFTILVDEN